MTYCFTGDPAVIDLNVLARLLAYDQAKVAKLALKFVESSRTGFEEMERALEAGDIERVRALGHRIKSAARMVGAIGLADLCQRLETLPAASPEAERVAAEPLVACVWLLFERITEHIAQNTSRAGPAG